MNITTSDKKRIAVSQAEFDVINKLYPLVKHGDAFIIKKEIAKMDTILNILRQENVALTIDTIQMALSLQSQADTRNMIEISTFIKERVDDFFDTHCYDDETCLFLYKVCAEFNREAQKKELLDTVLFYFDSVSQTEQFAHLPLSEVKSTIGHESMIEKSRLILWKAIINWLNYPGRDADKNEEILCELLNVVGFETIEEELFSGKILPYCSINRYNSVIADYNRRNSHFSLIGNCPEQKSIVIERIDIDHDHTVLATMPIANCIPPFLGEAKATYKDELLIVGGKNKNGHIMDQIATINLKNKEKPAIRHGKIITAREWHIIARSKEAFYIAGGFHYLEVLNSVEMLVFNGEEWMSVETNPMPEERACAASCVLNGYLYVIGGRNKKEILGSVYRYNTEPDITAAGNAIGMSGAKPKLNDSSIEARRYKRRKSQPVYIHSARSARNATSPRDFTKDSRRYSIRKSFKVFSTGTNGWTRMADLNLARNFPGCAVHGGRIYVAGGTTKMTDNGTVEETKTVECYDPVTNEWTTMIDKLNVGRDIPSLISRVGRLFVCGGNDAHMNPVLDVECYDFNREWNGWKRCPGLKLNSNIAINVPLFQ